MLVTDDDDDDVDTSWNDPCITDAGGNVGDAVGVCTTDTGGTVGDAVGVEPHLVVVGSAW